MNKHIEYIICPNCGSLQIVQVDLWWSYNHICNECEYIIMEDEWQVYHNIRIWRKIILKANKFINLLLNK